MKILVLNKKSFALILAVFVLLAFSITGMTVVSVLSRRTANYVGQIDSLRASYVAEAARSYYLEKISFAAAFTDPDAAVFSKTLGGATCSISYKTQSARSATIVFTGTTTTNRSYEITNLVEENSRTIDPSRVTTPTIVDHIRKFNLIVWGSTDTSTPPYIRINRVYPATCDQCVSPAGACTSSFGQNFFANTYFNAPLWLTGKYAKSSCAYWYYNTADDPTDPPTTGTTSTESRAVWGESTKPKNLYVNGAIDFSQIYLRTNYTPVTTPYGAWGTAYYKTTLSGPAAAFHNTTTPSVNCDTNPTNPECQNWPTVKPTLNLAYYDAIITKAASLTYGGLTIDSNSPLRNLNNRNIYVNGSVTIQTTDSAKPLQGPGNIIATGDIYIGFSPNTSYVGEKIGLITAGRIYIGTSGTRIGGTYNSASDLIDGAGVLIYSRSGSTYLTTGSRVKAFCVLKDNTTATPGVSFGFSLFGPLWNCYGTGAYSQLQGLVYTETTASDLGRIYGNALIETISSDPGVPGTSNTTGLGFGSLWDTFPTGSGHTTTISELPLRIRGLYNLLITTP